MWLSRFLWFFTSVSWGWFSLAQILLIVQTTATSLSNFVSLSLIFLFVLLFSSFPYLSCFPFLDLITLLRVSNFIFAVFPFRSFDFQRVKRKQTRIHFDKILRNHRSRVKCAKYWNLVAKLLCFYQPVTRTKTQTTGGTTKQSKLQPVQSSF